MIKIVHKFKGETILQPISCVLSLIINGAWVVKMEYPYDREGKWEYIEEDNVLYIDINCLDGVDTEQRYRINLVQRSLTGIYVEAYPVALDAFNDGVIKSLTLNNATASQLANALDRNHYVYQVTTNISDDIRADVSYKHTNLIAVINGDEDSFVGKFGGEVRYNNAKIAINNRLDSGNTAYIYTGRDVSSLTHSINTSDVVTRLYPISADGFMLNEEYVDSPLIYQYGKIHSEFIQTHFVVCTEDAKSKDVDAYNLTAGYHDLLLITLQNNIEPLVEVREAWGSYKRNVEYIKDTMKRTKAKDKWRGLIERLQDEFSAPLQDNAFIQIVRNWIKESLTFIDDIDIDDRDEYNIIKLDLPEPTGIKYIYASGNASAHGEPVKSEWVRIDNKWRWFNSSGYLVSSKDDNHNWSWFTRSGTKYYGYKADDADDDIRVKNQWLKINGEWYWFKSNGTHDKPKDVGNAINNYFLDVVDGYISLVEGWEINLYTTMFNRMIAYCNKMYDEGVDKPKMEINLEAMDISQIEGYQQLQTLHLGNNVVFRNNGTTINERVVELDYDCIRNVNTRVVLGMPTETISAIITRNMNQGQNLIAGYGVSIDGNTINVASGGGEAKAGLRWWEETSNHIERTMTTVPSGGWTCDDEYLITSPKHWRVMIDQGFANWNYSHDGDKSIGAWMHFYYSSSQYQGPVIISTNADAVKYMVDMEGLTTAFSTTISYGGLTWYVGGGNGAGIDTGSGATNPKGGCLDNDNWAFMGGLPEIDTMYDTFYRAVINLFEVANVRTRNSFITGINVGENYPFYGGFVASGSMTPENAPYRVRQDGMIYGKDVVAGNHVLSNKQDKLTAGQNVQIEGNTISATDTTYSAGDNITIDENNVISASGNLEAIELTRAEYNALTPAEKSDLTKIYFVYD